jgi:4-amino-4-deoxy-L-arabinose transferase-like glycosyltransferase
MHQLRLAFFLAATGLCLVSLAARAPLIDPDEGLHAAIAQEMLLRHDYVTPTFLGEPFLDKPILFFWAEAASLQLFGMNETAVRLPPLLFGFAGACTVVILGATMFGTSIGFAAGIVYATMILPIGVSEVAVHDVALIPFLVLACWGIWRITEGAPLVPWALGIGLCIGLSILTKGLVGTAFAGLFGLALVAMRRGTLPRLIVAGLIAGAVAAAVAAPWYLAMERAHPGYLHYYFVQRHVQGYFTSTQRHAGRGWWYYLAIVVGGGLPWLPFAFTRNRNSDHRLARRVVWIWFFAGLLFLSAGQSKLATYVLPIFPALAMGIGAHVLHAVHLGHRGRRLAVLIAFTAACALLPWAAAIGVAMRYPVHLTTLVIAATIATALIVLLARAAWRGSATTAVPRMAAMAFAAFAAVLLAALPQTARWMTAKDLATILNSRGALPSRVLVLDERIGSVVFYLSPELRAEATPDRFADTTLADLFHQIDREPADTLFAVRTDQLPRVQKLFSRPVTPDAQSGVYSVFTLATLRQSTRR